ncbi:ISL3 family transposase, partial [Enterococcus faecium]
VNKLDPTAQLIIDRLHSGQHIGRTFRNHRIKEPNQLLKSKEQKHYQLGKQFKRYWNLLQKDERKLDYTRLLWRPVFKAHLT